MRVRPRRVLLLFALGAACLFSAATSTWQNKNFKDWTDKDARAVVTDSPWSKQMAMPTFGRPDVVYLEPGANGAPPPSASLGNPANTTTGANMSVSGNPGSAHQNDPDVAHNNLPTGQTISTTSGSTGAPVVQPPITILWASATPVRLAMLKLRSTGQTPTEEEIENVHKTRPNYVIAVIGLPAPEGGSDPKGLASSAFLTVRGKTAIAANDSTYRKIGNSDVYFFRFTRASLPIALSDQQVEFRMTMGKIELKKKFDLKDMQYEGELTL